MASVGTADQVRSCAPSDIETVDLGGKTVVPGFIETHNHLSSYALTLVMADCTPRANARIRDIQDKVHEMAKSAGPGQWVVGWGYDDTQIEEMRHLHRADLDKAAPENPVFVYHASGHLSYASTHGLEARQRDQEHATAGKEEPSTKTMNGEPTGLLMEPAAQHLVAEQLPRPDVSIFMSLFPEAIAHYNRDGRHQYPRRRHRHTRSGDGHGSGIS